MYNRYIPQQDGTYQKNRVPSAQDMQSQRENKTVPSSCESSHSNDHQHAGAFDFLKRLLPKNLDTGDLIIILLLLLMAGDYQDGKNSWLLTLALYLFL